jgi:hypothetical protein
MKKFVLVMSLFLATGCAASVSNNESVNKNPSLEVTKANPNAPITQVPNFPTLQPETPAASNPNTIPNQNTSANFPDPNVTYADFVNGKTFNVSWYDSALTKHKTCDPQNSYCYADYNAVGKINSGPLRGYEVNIGGGNCLGGCWVHFISFKGQDLRLDGPSGSGEVNTSGKVTGLIDAPAQLNLPNTSYKLKLASYNGAMFKDLTLGQKIFTDPVLGPVYRDSNGCLVAEDHDHMAIFYSLDLPFITSDLSNDKVDFTLNNGTKNTDSYAYRVLTCGSYCLPLRYQSEAILKPDKRLQIIGHMNNGNPVLSISSSNDAVLKDLYNDKNTVMYAHDYNNPDANPKNQYSYSQFIALNPLVYWQDPLGYWVEFRNHKTDIAAEMCKPVIYLYPTTTTDISVKVSPNGGITYSKPDYGNGWNVTATPQSKITDKKTGIVYPYLFWEGIGLDFPVQNKGWVVKKADLSKFLDQKVSELGLNEKELTDFKEYWLQRLNEAGYYQISFVPQYEFNQVAPLTVGPSNPKTIIRVMMTAQALSAPKIIEPQILDVPAQRQGFTLVEWGGVVWK